MLDDPKDRGYSLAGRISYALTKIKFDTIQIVPIVGSGFGRAADTICAKVNWAVDFIAERETTRRGAVCDAVRDSVAEHQLGDLSRPAVPTASVRATDDDLRR